MGNRVDSNQNGLSTFNAANQLEEDTGFNYLYDAIGNLIQKTDKSTLLSTVYEYDAENKLIRVASLDKTVNYNYDGLGRRIEKEVTETAVTNVTQYIYDNEDILLELDGSDNIVARYTHGPGIDEALSMEKAGVNSFYHADGLESVTELTDSLGTVVQSYTYSSFGKIESQLDLNFFQPYTFTGREFDPETDLYYYRSRYYDPFVGRFLQEDPILNAGNPTVPYLVPSLLHDPLTLHGHAYVNNNPQFITDPFGLFPWTFVFRVVRGVLQLGPVSVGVDILGGRQCVGGCPLNEGEDELFRNWLANQNELTRQRQFNEETDKFIEDLCRTGRFPLSCGPTREPFMLTPDTSGNAC